MVQHLAEQGRETHCRLDCFKAFTERHAEL